MVVLPLTKNRVALIDSGFAPIANQFSWSFDGRYAATYICTKKKKIKIYLHQMVAGKKTKLIVDHVNQNKLDNRFENLRHVTKSKNALNTNASGTYFVKSGKRKKRWTAKVHVNGTSIFLGYFLTEHEARAAYREKVKTV